MAGSRAPSGSLRKIADSVPKAGSRKTGVFGATKPNAPKFKPGTFTGDDSGSDSSSSSDDDSSSGSDSDSKSEPLSELQKRISQTPAKTKVKTDSKVVTPAKSPTVNGLTASFQKKSPSQKIKKEHSSEEESDSDEEDKPGQNKSKDKKKAIKAESSSSESSSSESSSSESESGESESESEDEQDSDDAAQQIEEQLRNEFNSAKPSSAMSQASEKPSKKAKVPKAPVSEDKNSDVEMVDQSMALTNGGSPTKVGSVPEFIAPDFHLRKLDGTPDATEIANFFSKAQMEGKQVWYITTPASLPVTVVHDLTIPMDEAEKGKPVLNHNGEDYRMAFDNPSASSSFRLLVPNKKGDEYSLINWPISQSVHITRSETFGPGGASSVTSTQTVVTTKPARPQPEGLRARYTPLGVANPKPTITAPPPVQKAATSVAAALSVPGASSKKKRKHSDNGEDGPIATAVTTPTRKDTPSGKKNPTAEKSAKKQKTRNKADQPSVPRQQTPVPVPTRINGAYRSGSSAPATQPAPRSRSSASPGAGLPATQVKFKQSPIPLPPIPKTTSSGQLGTTRPSLAEDKKREQPVQKVKKEKKMKAEKDESPAIQTPRKMTKILPPQFDSQGRPIA